MTHDINYPSTVTYFIANTGNVYSHGIVNPDQCMSTGLDNIETLPDIETYNARLVALGIDSDI